MKPSGWSSLPSEPVAARARWARELRTRSSRAHRVDPQRSGWEARTSEGVALVRLSNAFGGDGGVVLVRMLLQVKALLGLKQESADGLARGQTPTRAAAETGSQANRAHADQRVGPKHAVN